MKLLDQSYGKARVRILKVRRAGKKHSVKELEVRVMLQGEFEASYTRADNRRVVATDSMKNTVQVLAKEKLGEENEPFGVALAEHFLKAYPQVRKVEVELTEHCWERISVRGKPHPHSFMERSGGRPWGRVVGTRKGSQVESGIADLLILKSTGSGFADFVRDQFTTLPETGDRVFATKMTAMWTYQRRPRHFGERNRKILEAMLGVFAREFSASVQATLYRMGEAALRVAPEVEKVSIQMPNKHCLLVNLAAFGVENRNELFTPTDEPHGQIEATVGR